MLGAGGNGVFVFVQLALDVPRHGNGEGPFVVIPYELYSAVKVARPVFDECIFLTDAFYKVVGMLLAHIFDTEIVDNKQESDWPPFVLPESQSVGAFMITVGGKSFPQEFVGKK
jgi:hypothetical protein